MTKHIQRATLPNYIPVDHSEIEILTWDYSENYGFVTCKYSGWWTTEFNTLLAEWHEIIDIALSDLHIIDDARGDNSMVEAESYWQETFEWWRWLTDSNEKEKMLQYAVLNHLKNRKTDQARLKEAEEINKAV